MRDAEMRYLLKQALIKRHGAERDTIVVEELGLCRGSVRADVAIINGVIKGFEIKSEHDSLRRLLTQATIYSRVFDEATLITVERHLPEAIPALPDWWGVEVVYSDGTFIDLRPCRSNPLIDGESLALLLWRDEAISVLNNTGVKTERSQSRQSLCSRLAKSLPLDELGRAVCTALKNRSDERFGLQRLRDGAMFRPSSMSLDSQYRPARPRSRRYTYRPS